ncbi:S1-like domain-containing RNA-binding protein [Clostridium sediminicola]|uniref:CvfB family protein n=1 Tax=Clostridium sediminicola TaxID=3114879 RepID=UPI0031F22F60
MIEIGKKQKMTITYFKDFGAFLDGGTEEKEDNILLPKNQLTDDLKEGDEVEVFIYKDSEDRLIATREMPYIQVEEIAQLQVKEITRIGAFLDMGLKKDLFLPYKEQKYSVQAGDKLLVAMYVDKTSRLSATMFLENFLRSDSEYKVDDMVKGIVYSVNPTLGALVAVDNKYRALIQDIQFAGKIKVGEKVEARVVRITEEGNLDLSFRKVAYKQMDDDAAYILEVMENIYNGNMPLNDKSKPEEIKSRLKMSKNAFKRAVGRLLKEGKIEILNDGIRIKNKAGR